MMDTSARPANHSSARDRGGHREDNEILPPDHLNGVKLEMDGHLNKDFHQEVFLGKDTDGFEEDAEPRKSRRKLMVIFSKWVPGRLGGGALAALLVHPDRPAREGMCCRGGSVTAPGQQLGEFAGSQGSS